MDADDDEAARVAENVSAQFDASKGPEGSKVSETRRPRWTAHAMAEARDLVRDFLGSVPGKCENCGCASPKIVPEGATRLYRHALTGKQREVNAALGVDLEAELEALAHRGAARTAPSSREKRSRKATRKRLKKTSTPRRRRRRRRRREGNRRAGRTRRTTTNPRSDAGSDSDAGLDSDADGSGSDSDGSDAPKTKSKTRTDDPRTNEANEANAPSSKKFLITTDEALCLLEKLWAREYDFCAMVWVASAAPAKASSAGSYSEITSVNGDPLKTRPQAPRASS